MDPLVDPALGSWLHRLQPSNDDVLAAMEEEGDRRGFPIIGPLVGRLCHLLASAVGAKRVFEMGSGFGYSTVWFARAVGADGTVWHTDGDPENTAAAKQWLEQAGVLDRVSFHTGDALAAMEAQQGPFDIVFIDVDKDAYPRCWELAKQRVRVGGLIITDNTLWSGKVADPGVDDDWTQAIREYDRLATSDPDYQTSILPLRDGVAVSLRLR